MKPSRIAPSGATAPTRVPPSGRAPSTSHPHEGPAPRVAGAPSEPACAAASLEPTGSPPSSSSSPSSPSPSLTSAPSAFLWPDALHTRAWLTTVRESANDLAALAREGSRRASHRVLARAELRRQTRVAARSLRTLLAQAEATLPPHQEA
jgi:hypothetical protein